MFTLDFTKRQCLAEAILWNKRGIKLVSEEKKYRNFEFVNM